MRTGRLIGILAAAIAMALAASCLLVKHRVWEPNLMLARGGTQGVDLSEHQGEADFAALEAAGVEFAYLKATEGSSHVDSQFARSWALAEGSGVAVGAYHFFSFDSPGAAQAAHFLSTVGDMRGRLVPAVDVEWYGDKREDPPETEDVLRELSAFIDAVEEGCGARPVVYAEAGLYRRYGLAGELGGCRVWACSTRLPAFVEWGGSWSIWQYSSRGRIPGVGNDDGHVDLDVLARGVEIDDLIVR